METSQGWINYFRQNLLKKRIDWTTEVGLLPHQRKTILASLQAWQLGETSDGRNLIAAAQRYAKKFNDPRYVEAVHLFIKEEQKHGANLGLYLDRIGEPHVRQNWGDTLFRKVRYFNKSMEMWTLAVITVECAAQLFYQCLKDATDCKLLKQICTDILIDEAPHIRFQQERLQIIFTGKKHPSKTLSYSFYKFFYFSTIAVVWLGHRKVFKAGGHDWISYLHTMNCKFKKTIGRLKTKKETGRISQPRRAVLAS